MHNKIAAFIRDCLPVYAMRGDPVLLEEKLKLFAFPVSSVRFSVFLNSFNFCLISILIAVWNSNGLFIWSPMGSF